MKYLSHLLVIVGLLLPASVFAADEEEKSYLNLGFYSTTSILYLSQSTANNCKIGTNQNVAGHVVRCVDSRTVTPSTMVQELKDMLGKYWKKDPDKSKGESGRLYLDSDIDFMQSVNASNASCSNEFSALTFSGNIFWGGMAGYKVKNLCATVSSDLTEPFGLFSEIDNVEVKNLTISGVHFVKAYNTGTFEDATENPNDFPVGALAGSIKNIHDKPISNVILEDVNISAPIAGGLAGKISSSEINGIILSSVNVEGSTAGGLASSISNSEVSGIKFGTVNVEGPFAGGLAANADHSTISSVSMQEDASGVVQVVNRTVPSNSNSDMGSNNVLLGGLVGASYINTIHDITIYPSIQNSANVGKSSLGGLAGMFVYAESGSPAEVFVQDVSVTGATLSDNVVIQGGSIMGGLIGETQRNGSNAKLLIKNALVKGLKMSDSRITANAVRGIFMGGIVGNSDLCDAGVLKIIDSRSSNFTITENVKNAGTYHYYVGGIAGYAGCGLNDNAYGGSDLYLTLTNSRATGSISMTGGYDPTSAGGTYRVSSNVGGLVGAALCGTDDNAVSNNTVNVDIRYEVKRSKNSGVTATANDSLAVGGAFGSIGVYNTSGSEVPLQIKNLQVTAPIQIEDDGLYSYVGGVIGRFPNIGNQGNSHILFNDVSVSGANISVSSGSESVEGKYIVVYGGPGSTASNTDAYVGGVCGNCLSIDSIYRVSVDGHIYKYDGSLSKKSFFVGGLIGGSQLMSNPTVVQNTYSNGIISDFGTATGYLIGELSGGGISQTNEFIANYHYGSDDVPAIGRLGTSTNKVAEKIMLTEKSNTQTNYWIKNWYVKANVRNASAQETAKADDYNGTMAGSKMATVDFVDVLNGAQKYAADQIWMLESATDAAKYPVFKEVSDDQFLVTFMYGNLVLDKVMVPSGETAAPTKDIVLQRGHCFAGWDQSLKNVTAPMTVNAVYNECFEVTFNDLDGHALVNPKSKADGKPLNNPQIVMKGASAIEPEDPEPIDGRCFAGWSLNTDDYYHVMDHMTVSAYSKECEYTVTFAYKTEEGNDAEKKVSVKHNEDATPPGADVVPQVLGDECFTGWDGDYTGVTADITVHAEYGVCKQSSSSESESSSSALQSSSSEMVIIIGSSSSAIDESSSSALASSSSANVSSSSASLNSSSSAVNSSGSTAKSSSSVTSSTSGDKSSSSNTKSSSSGAKSSSSNSFIFQMAKPTVTKEGNVLRMEFNDTLSGAHAKVDYHVVVVSETGIYLDTVVDGEVVEKAKNGMWRLDPAPAGDYHVTFTLTDGENTVSYSTPTFSSEKEKKVDLAADSWQTYSLYAFCANKDESCVYDLEERFTNREVTWAIEECNHMKAELNNGFVPDGDWFYQQMDEACRVASASEDIATTAVYWWDESNPVGDYWQYRKFDVNQEFDSTRGYWYGPIEDDSLTLGLQTPNMDDEIVWNLRNDYSGWNLVANPFGWYVKLPQEKNMKFRRWNSAFSQYEPVEILGPYEAMWVYTDKSREFRIPLKATIVLEDAEQKALSKSASSENWNLRVVLSDDKGKRDSWNELAAGRTASSEIEPPAGMGDRVNLSIVEGGKRLEKSVKQNGDDLVWNLEASATSYRKGHLNFVGLEKVLAKGMHVYATVGDETVEVVDDSPVNVMLSSKTKNVSVRVTKNAVAMSVAKNWLTGLRVNQAPNALNVGFDAASKLAGANVKVSVVGVDGRIVSTGRSVANEGSNVISMQKPKQGVYFVRVKVGSQTASTRILVH